MKCSYLVSIGLVACSLLACKKKQEAAAPPVTVAGEAVQLPQITAPAPKKGQDPAAQAAERDVQNGISQAMYWIRYQNYASAKAELDKVSSYPNLTQAQKDSINKTIEQLNNAMKADPRTAH